MLVLYRRVGESITLRLADDIDPATPVGEIINNGDITVSLNWIGQTSARLGVKAPRAFKVVRSELLEKVEAG